MVWFMTAKPFADAGLGMNSITSMSITLISLLPISARRCPEVLAMDRSCLGGEVVEGTF